MKYEFRGPVMGKGEPGTERPVSGVMERPRGVNEPLGEIGAPFEIVDLASD